MKIYRHGRDKVIIHPRFEKGLLAKLHPFFQKPSDCAITYSLAQRLSRSMVFKSTVEAFKLSDLDSLCDQMVRLDQTFPGEGRTTLKVSNRFIIDGENLVLTVLLSDQAESGKDQDRRLETQVVLQGRIVKARILTIDQHLRDLKESGNFAELMMLADDPEYLLTCGLYAIDCLAEAPGLQAHKFLLDLSKRPEERQAIRALHALAVRGEAHDLVGQLVRIGGRIIDRLLGPKEGRNGREDFDLYLVMRSLAAIRTPDHQAAIDLFRRMDSKTERGFTPEQEALLMSLKEDNFSYAKWLAVSLVEDRVGPILDLFK